MSGAVQAPVFVVGAVAAALIVDTATFFVLRRAARRAGADVARVYVGRVHQPARLLLVSLAILLVLPATGLGDDVRGPLGHGIVLVALAAVGWLALGATYLTEALIVRHYDISVPDNVVARRARTQTAVLRRVVIFALMVIIASAMLMTFARARALGASILASAGLVGLVVGLAARPTLENIMAGLQIALGNALRIDDVVIVEEEWGRVEEITLTYVVVRTWDERRLILPISYFVTQPFENWTRKEAKLIGVVLLCVDHSVPMRALRAELARLLRESALWDGRVCNVQLVDATDRWLQVRVLVSARDASTLWDLRCAVREGLVDYLRDCHPHALPHTHVEFDGVNAPARPAGRGGGRDGGVGPGVRMHQRTGSGG